MLQVLLFLILVISLLGSFSIINSEAFFHMKTYEKNSLEGCIHQYMNKFNENMNQYSEYEKQNIEKHPFYGKESINNIVTEACILSFQKTGTYLNMLPPEQQRQFMDNLIITNFLSR